MCGYSLWSHSTGEYRQYCHSPGTWSMTRPLNCISRITSILTVFVNKALLSSDTMNLDAPLFVTWIQCIVSALLSLGLKSFRKSARPAASVFSREVAAKVLPLAMLFTAMIATNNLCLKYVDVSFYYIGRSLTTVFNVILSYVLLRQTSSSNCIMCCALIVGGFWLGVDQERIAGNSSYCELNWIQFSPNFFVCFFQNHSHWLAPYSEYWAPSVYRSTRFTRRRRCQKLATKFSCSAITWTCMRCWFSFRWLSAPARYRCWLRMTIFGRFGFGRHCWSVVCSVFLLALPLRCKSNTHHRSATTYPVRPRHVHKRWLQRNGITIRKLSCGGYRMLSFCSAAVYMRASNNSKWIKSSVKVFWGMKISENVCWSDIHSIYCI